MSKSELSIERLQIRLRGSSANEAKALSSELPGELARQLATLSLAHDPGITMEHVDAGVLHLPAGVNTREVQQRVAKQIVAGLVRVIGK